MTEEVNTETQCSCMSERGGGGPELFSRYQFKKLSNLDKASRVQSVDPLPPSPNEVIKEKQLYLSPHVSELL